jgi:hypothetical protein
MRKTIAALTTVAAMTGLNSAVLTGSSHAASVKAATSCRSTTYPSPNIIVQNNGWNVRMVFDGSEWSAEATHPGVDYTLYGEVTFLSKTRADYRFIITWDNDSAGTYAGYVDQNGFIQGKTADKWTPGSRATWHMMRVARCNR